MRGVAGRMQRGRRLDAWGCRRAWLSGARTTLSLFHVTASVSFPRGAMKRPLSTAVSSCSSNSTSASQWKEKSSGRPSRRPPPACSMIARRSSRFASYLGSSSASTDTLVARTSSPRERPSRFASASSASTASASCASTCSTATAPSPAPAPAPAPAAPCSPLPAGGCSSKSKQRQMASAAPPEPRRSTTGQPPTRNSRTVLSVLGPPSTTTSTIGTE